MSGQDACPTDDNVLPGPGRLRGTGRDRYGGQVVRGFDLRIERLACFQAFDGAAGAKSFGYPTVWVNRFDQPNEQLGIRPDHTVSDLGGLLEYVLNTTPVPPQKP